MKGHFYSYLYFCKLCKVQSIKYKIQVQNFVKKMYNENPVRESLIFDNLLSFTCITNINNLAKCFMTEKAFRYRFISHLITLVLTHSLSFVLVCCNGVIQVYFYFILIVLCLSFILVSIV